MGTPLSVLNWIKNSISYPAEGDILKKYKALAEAPVDKSVMAEMPAKDFVAKEKIRPFSEEFADTVKETVQKYSQPKEVVRFLSEMAIDPTNYIPAAKGIGVAGAGAGILSLLMKKGTISPSRAAIGMDLEKQIGAFRPEGSKISPTSLQGIIQTRNNAWRGIEWMPEERQQALEEAILKAVSDKELAKYGAPSFKLDDVLPSTRNPAFFHTKPENTMQGLLSELHYLRADIAEEERKTKIYHMNWEREVKDWPQDDIPYHNVYLDSIKKLKGQEQAQLKAIKEKKEYGTDIWTVQAYAASNDITLGIQTVARDMTNSPLSIPDLSRKSLVQLLSVAEEGKKIRLAREEAAARSDALIPEFTKKRTATLKEEQKFPYNFVELKTPADMGAETHYLNHCVGAGGMDPATGKFKPQFHPVTGEEIIKNDTSSFKRYYGKIQSGEERLFSYRPDGEPVFTLRIDAKTGKSIEEKGLNNRDLTRVEETLIDSFKQKLRTDDPANYGNWIIE